MHRRNSSSGIKRVVVGATDPNPQHAGRAFGILRAAGIAIDAGILGAECTALNAGFNRWVTTGMPFVIAKAGLSLDGRFTRPSGEGQWLTSAESRTDAMRLRAKVDAILVGGRTVREDNPRLTIRGEGIRTSRQPWRVVITQSGRLPRQAHLFTDEHRERTLVYRRQPIETVLKDLGSRGCTTVMIEAGGGLLGAAFDARLVDRVQFYLGPLLCGGPDVIAGEGAGSSLGAPKLENVRYRKVGPDLRMTGDIRNPA